MRGRRLGRRSARRRHERADSRNGGRGQESLHQSHLNPPRAPRRRRLRANELPTPSACPRAGVLRQRNFQRTRQGRPHQGAPYTGRRRSTSATGGRRCRGVVAVTRRRMAARPTRPCPHPAPGHTGGRARSAGGMIPATHASPDRTAGPRSDARAGRPLLRHDARRHGRRGHQDRGADRGRRHAHMGAAPGRVEHLLSRPEPQQEEPRHRSEVRRRRRTCSLV